MTLELHPLCALFPRMDGKEFESLKADIKANGLRQPIVTYKGMILDGGNRYAACLAVGFDPQMTEYQGENLVTYVMSANFHRRHLSSGQQAAIVASATDWAKAQKHGGDRKKIGSPSALPDQAEALPLETVKERASLSGATERTQRDADKLAKTNPEALKQVAHGKKSLYQAVKEQSPKPKPQKADPIEYGITDDELLEENTRVQTENDLLNDTIKSLQVSDKDAEIKKLQERVYGLEGRLQQLMASEKAMESKLKYQTDLIHKLRKIYGVDTHAEILSAAQAQVA